MHVILSNAGRAAIKAMASALIVIAPGLLAQPNFNGSVALGIAALMAIIAAGLAAAQSAIPESTVEHYLPGLTGKVLDSFVRGFLAYIIVALTGFLAEPTLGTWHAVIVGAVMGAINAGLRAVQAVLTPGEAPLPHRGVPNPPPTAAPPATP